MTELQKTMIFAGVAVLLAGAAFVRAPDRALHNATFNDQGEKFFPEFKDPRDCTDLEVIDYDPSTARVGRFQVKLKDGKWVIPSHFDYPADAKDRLARTAGGVIDLTKDTIRSDRVEDHEEMNVIDPLDDKTNVLKGRGKRVTLRDKSEKVLADFIIGNEVKDRSGQRYVRVPGQKRTYGVKVNVDLSTRFADWIETNLLKLDSSRVRRVAFDLRKFDPDRGVIIPGDVLSVERKDASGPWTTTAEVPAGQELDSDKLQTLLTALGDLKIVGVRPKPEGLSQDLKVSASGDIKELTRQTFASLVSKGFYPTREGLYSNQGEVIVSTDEGVVYTLRYGEVFIAGGLELSAGVENAKAAGKGKDKDQKTAEGSTENRYLFVTARFDPALVPPPPAPAPRPVALPDDPFLKDPNDPKRIAEQTKAKEEETKAKEKADRDQADYDRRVGDGRKRVKELTDRFAGWYYVTPGDSFHAIMLDRAALIHPKPAKPEASSPAGAPNLNLPDTSGFHHP